MIADWLCPAATVFVLAVLICALGILVDRARRRRRARQAQPIARRPRHRSPPAAPPSPC